MISRFTKRFSAGRNSTLRTTKMSNCCPGTASPKPPVYHSGRMRGERQRHSPLSPYLERRLGQGGCRSQQRVAPGLRGPSQAATSPNLGRIWAEVGFAALRPEPRRPVCPQRPVPSAGGSEARSRPPGGGAREIRFALPTRPLSGGQGQRVGFGSRSPSANC